MRTRRAQRCRGAQTSYVRDVAEKGPGIAGTLALKINGKEKATSLVEITNIGDEQLLLSRSIADDQIATGLSNNALGMNSSMLLLPRRQRNMSKQKPLTVL